MYKYIVGLLGIIHCLPLYAEVTLDGTLGTRGSLTGPDYAIRAELGQQRGSNLFHSFGQFNLNNGESATFSGPTDIRNIISRVTGGNPSFIDGTLRSTIPEADVYLLNPNGLLFGKNAQLDIKGSFHASTADYLRLGNEGQFNAKQPQATLLSVATPSAFGFLSDTPASLTIQGSQLAVPDHKTLSLISGNLQIDQASLIASAGRLNLVSIAEPGEITLAPQSIVITKNRGDISIQGDSLLSTSGKAESRTTAGSIYLQAGQLTIQTSNLESNSYGAESAGGIHIQARTVKILAGGELASNTLGAGKGGNVTIQAIEAVEIVGEKLSDGAVKVSGIRVRSGKPGEVTDNTGNAGDIIIRASDVRLNQGTVMSTATFGKGQGGDISIIVSGELSLSGQASDGFGGDVAADTWRTSDNGGNGGTITIQANHLHLDEGGQIGASSQGTGQGGNINIDVSGYTTLVGKSRRNKSSGILLGANGRTATAGKAGKLSLKTGFLILKDGTTISTQTRRSDGGDIEIIASGYLYLLNSNVTTSVKSESGNGGNVTLNPEFIILDNAKIIAQAKQGNGGNILITTTGIYKFSPGAIEEDINASSERGISGVVTVNSPDSNVTAGLLALPSMLIDANALLLNPCGVNKHNASHFIVTPMEANVHTPESLQISQPLTCKKIAP